MIYSLLVSVLINLSSIPITNNQETVSQPKNKIDNYEVITISQSGSLFYSVTNQIIESVKNLESNVTFIGRANVGLESTTAPNEEIKVSTLENFLYSVSVKTIDSTVTNMFYDADTADVINSGMLVVSSLTSERYQLEVGDIVNFVGLNNEKIALEVGKVIKDSTLGWFEIVVNKEVGYKLGIFRNIQAIIWDSKVNENFFIELHKNIDYRKVKFTYKKPSPNKNWVLPNALVKEMFGDFQIKERDGVWITTEPEWREENIQNKRMPILGITRCHRLMWEPLEGALNQILEEGLEGYLSIEEWRSSGGCYAPRRISRFDAGGSISRHAWGIAIDINTKSGYPPRIVEIFNSWGFAWGGTWTSPDEMHFELRDLSASISKSSG
ncbi:MAG: M15 family metallopeptidase [Candidatus Actinomarinales bacterium]|nr:M15 family metallopeptidase [Candidatus Actinomarinales bacterium]